MVTRELKGVDQRAFTFCMGANELCQEDGLTQFFYYRSHLGLLYMVATGSKIRYNFQSEKERMKY